MTDFDTIWRIQNEVMEQREQSQTCLSLPNSDRTRESQIRTVMDAAVGCGI